MDSLHSLLEDRSCSFEALLSSVDRVDDKSTTTSSWLKGYQADYGRFKPSSDERVSFFDLSTSPDLSSLISSSLSRVGILSEQTEPALRRCYQCLQGFIREIRDDQYFPVSEWLVDHADPEDRASLQLLCEIFNRELAHLYASSTAGCKSMEIIKFRAILARVLSKNASLYKSINFTNLVRAPPNTQDGKRQVLDGFSNLYMKKNNLPVYDILKLSVTTGLYSLDFLRKVFYLYQASSTPISQMRELPVLQFSDCIGSHTLEGV
jgi:hypothetical protein